jgi:hypothetical protein
VADIDLHIISVAVSNARADAERNRLTARGFEADRRANSDYNAAIQAERELERLRAVWPRCVSLLRDADRAYDQHVLTPTKE